MISFFYILQRKHPNTRSTIIFETWQPTILVFLGQDGASLGAGQAAWLQWSRLPRRAQTQDQTLLG